MTTHAIFHFAEAPGEAPAADFMLFTEGNPTQVGALLRAMLRQTRECHANAFLQTVGNQALLLTESVPASQNAGYRYRLAGQRIVVEQLTKQGPAVSHYEGPLLDFLNAQPLGEYLHELPITPGGPVAYFVLSELVEKYQAADLAHFKSLVEVGGRGIARAATHRETCRTRLMLAVIRQTEAGRPLNW